MIGKIETTIGVSNRGDINTGQWLQTYRKGWRNKRGKRLLLDIMCVCTQSCPTLCDSMDCSLPGSSVHGISQARILEWVDFPGNLPDPGKRLLNWQADSLALRHLEIS